MNEYDFTLKFAYVDQSVDDENLIEQLGEVGCDDAIIGLGQKGRIALQFTRQAENAANAITSAIRQVKSVIPDAKLIESTPDLMGLSDMAELLGFSRQNMRKLMVTNIQSFPTPVHSGNTAIWHLASVLQWFEGKQRRVIESGIKEVALVNMHINVTQEYARLDKSGQAQLSALSI
ncbi:helix-turn-helix transcriptional regulator [Lacimicrobium alkaliphilum]|uniref:DNA-binding protein n=1 Tax=Lacimicrobium alkaliphilum TaxID=1526571 RepID=A0ABQ1R485_9ALTE|nr:DNA-binding protein [Lacimicrobium alkaliphilum]GGD55724.1 DNA-binding protein [Lacimicrobium alkaliphilum]